MFCSVWSSLVLSKNAWKLDRTSGLNTTGKIGFYHAVNTIEISYSTLTSKCFALSGLVLSKNAWNLNITSGLNTTDKIGFIHAVDTIEVSESTLPCKCLVFKTAPATPGF